MSAGRFNGQLRELRLIGAILGALVLCLGFMLPSEVAGPKSY